MQCLLKHANASTVLTMLVLSVVGRVGHAQFHPTDYVNTLRGTDSTPDFSRGNTFPAVTLPFGFNFWTPVTEGNSDGWLYKYRASTIQGFAVSHEPSPWIGDYASLQVMPSTGAVKLDPESRALAFRHEDETARAHFYRVAMSAPQITTEIAPTMHAAIFRFTFPNTSKTNNVLFDTIDQASGIFSADPADGSVSGYVDMKTPRMYFYATFDSPFQTVLHPKGGGANVAVRFSSNVGATVVMRIGTSFISAEQAKVHVVNETASLSFDEIKARAQAEWDELLGRVTVDGASESQKTTLYSSLYRTMMYPNTFTEEVDGSAKHFSPYANEVRDGPLYVNNGFWDTYRAAWPLYTLLVPNRVGVMLDGFVNAYKEGGWIPRWSGPGYNDCMVGSHANVVIADAYAKGIHDFDVGAAYDAMLKDALVYSSDPAQGRKGNEHAIFRDYLALEDVGESAAWHLEDSVCDFSISQMAQALGDEVHAGYFRRRALRYANLFSATTGFFRGRHTDGSFRSSDAEFLPEEWGYEYTEGCAWHYTMAASHDPRGMIALYGGDQAFADKIDAVLSASPNFLPGSYGNEIHEMREAFASGMGQYAHPNEPVHHMLYMYDYAGMPWKTQAAVRRVLSETGPFYGPGFDGGGYLGDEDNGEMSAWFILSALGLYPASPGHPEYAIGSPLFKEMTLHLENGQTFMVVARDNGPEHVYVQNANLNGQAYTKTFVSHADILAGGVLELDMGAAPSRWGTAPKDRPTSLTHDDRVSSPLRDCARGGRASASDENISEGETAAAAFDDDSGTKWLVFANHGHLQYELSDACPIEWYTLTSANDAAERDPMDWTLEGSLDQAQWTKLDERHGEVFRWRRQTRVFGTDNRGAYRFFRLNITMNHGGPSLQLAELELLEREVTPSTPDSSPGHPAALAGQCCARHGVVGAAGLGVMLCSVVILFVRRRMKPV